MRLIVISDIHGNDNLFRKALKTISLKKVDTLILIGDLIDRGKYSKNVLDTLFLLKNSGFENIIYIRGNHEQMLLDAYEDENKEYIWLKNGGDKTLQSFKVNFCNEIPNEYIQLLQSSIFYYETNDYIFVHGGINFEIENPLEDINSLLWTRNTSVELYRKSNLSEKKVIHGHTPVSKEDILKQFSNIEILNIDNGVYLDKEGFGSLTVMDLTNHKIFFVK